MKRFRYLVVILLFILTFVGCSLLPTENTPEDPMIGDTKVMLSNNNPDGEGIIYFTVMIHLEGWHDGKSEEKFNRHASLVREYADLFEKYGAVMTLESKDFTEGCIVWQDNVLKEMEDRGHGIGLHADLGGDKGLSTADFEQQLKKMKEELESLGVTVRHVSGVVSDKDWVTVCINNDFEAATGVVSYALWSLDEALRPPGFEPYKTPMKGHAIYHGILDSQLFHGEQTVALIGSFMIKTVNLLLFHLA